MSTSILKAKWTDFYNGKVSLKIIKKVASVAYRRSQFLSKSASNWVKAKGYELIGRITINSKASKPLF